MNSKFFFGGSHCLSQSVILFLDEIGGWRDDWVLFNSARGPNSTNHSALGPAFIACLRGLMENIIKVVQHTFLFTSDARRESPPLLSTKLYRLYLVSREILSRKIWHAEVIKFSYILP